LAVFILDVIPRENFFYDQNSKDGKDGKIETT